MKMLYLLIHFNVAHSKQHETALIYSFNIKMNNDEDKAATVDVAVGRSALLKPSPR